MRRPEPGEQHIFGDAPLVQLGHLSWPEVQAGLPLIVVPVGSLEQHGPHLPLDTDTRIATAVAESLPGIAVAPALTYGASGEHEGFSGTVSIGIEALSTMLLEYGRSICRWAHQAVFVNGHGGNARALAKAVSQLRYEGRDVAWFACAVPGADAHAGLTETSLLMHISPEVVAVDRIAVGVTDAVSTLMPRLRASGVSAVAANGVLGDPRGATADQGRRFLSDLGTQLHDAVAAWKPDRSGRL